MGSQQLRSGGAHWLTSVLGVSIDFATAVNEASGGVQWTTPCARDMTSFCPAMMAFVLVMIGASVRPTRDDS